MEQLKALRPSASDDELHNFVSAVLSDKQPFPEAFEGERLAVAQEWMEWAKGNKCLKVVTGDVPAEILADAKLYDVRVNPPRKGPRTDDAIYESDAEIRARVARGNCFLQLGAEDNMVCAVQVRNDAFYFLHFDDRA